LHLLIAILAWSLEDTMTWSPSHMYFFISSGVACHGRVWSLIPGASSKVNKDSPRSHCSKSSHWSFACSFSTAAHFLSTADLTMITIVIFSMITWSVRGLVMGNLIGILPVVKLLDGLSEIRLTLLSVVHVDATSAALGKNFVTL
jgi:hypothetical protein